MADKKPLTDEQKAAAQAKEARAKKKAEARQANATLQPDGPLQFKHLDKEGQALAAKKFATVGNTLRTELLNARRKSVAYVKNPTPGESADTLKGHEKTVKATAELLFPVKDSVIKNRRGHSIDSAASNRERLFNDASQRAKLHGDVRKGTPSDEEAAATGQTATSRKGAVGAGWYIDHGRDLRHVADTYGQNLDKVINASGIMSPMNGPANEKAAVSAIAHAVQGNHKITATTEEGARLLKVGVGESRNFNDIDTAILGKITNSKNAVHFDTKVKLKEIAKGGSFTEKGIQAMRSDIPGSVDYVPEDPAYHQTMADNIRTGKVPSYIQNIKSGARADANDISEYYRRGRAAAGVAEHDDPNQLSLLDESDPYGRAKSTKGILDPEGSTAEDTWMRSVDLNVPYALKEFGHRGGARVGKFLGSDPTINKFVSGNQVFPAHEDETEDPVSADMVRNAVSNEATIRAARNVSNKVRERDFTNGLPDSIGAGMPAMMMQETVWTDERIQGGKDPLVPKHLVEQSKGRAEGRLDHFTTGTQKHGLPAESRTKGARTSFEQANGITLRSKGKYIQQGLMESSLETPSEVGMMDISSTPLSAKEQAWSAGFPEREAARQAKLPKPPKSAGSPSREAAKKPKPSRSSGDVVRSDKELAWSAGFPEREAARKAKLPKTPRWEGDELL